MSLEELSSSSCHGRRCRTSKPLGRILKNIPSETTKNEAIADGRDPPLIPLTRSKPLEKFALHSVCDCL